MRTRVSANRDRIVIVALHGLVTSLAEIEFFLRPLMLGFPMKGIRWRVPRAPLRPVTLLAGQPARAWYDLCDWDDQQCKDEVGLQAATLAVEQMVEAERRNGVRAEQIVLAGFSQGGALALHAGLRLGYAIGGIVALSAALPAPAEIPAARPDSPPVFMAHGLLDAVVPSSWSGDSACLLEAQGYDVRCQGYPIGHTVSWQELGDVAAWLECRVLDEPRRGRTPLAALAGARARSEGSRAYAAQAL
jgi:phospholipase/carboxylesterase